jgi:hypothetical protein
MSAVSIIACPALLSAYLTSDPSITLVPLLAPPKSESVVEWVRQQELSKQQQLHSSKKDAVEPNKQPQFSAQERANNVSADDANTKSRGKVTADMTASDVNSEENDVEHLPVADEVLRVTSPGKLQSNAVDEDASLLSGSSNNRGADSDEASTGLMRDSSSQKQGQQVMVKLCTSDVVQCSDFICIHSPSSEGAQSSGSTSEGIRLSGVVAETGSDSTQRSSQMSFVKIGFAKACRVELELPSFCQMQSISENCEKTKADGQVDDTSLTGQSSLAADSEVPMASTPYNRRRNSSSARAKLMESPISFTPIKPQKSSVAEEAVRQPAAKSAQCLTTKFDCHAAVQTVPVK